MLAAPESNIENLSHHNLLLSPTGAQKKLPRKPVISNLFHKSYHEVQVNEELDELPTSSDRANKEKKWPSEPQGLNKWTWIRCVILGGDIILTLLPVIFLVFCICALALDRRPPSSFGDSIIAGTKLGPTIFPIIFAAIVGRLMRSIAHWKAEAGTQLGLLEQLIGSQNLTSAVQRMVLLDRYGPLGFAIVVLWLLSPLGGQSSLRLLNVVSSAVSSEAQVHYIDVNRTAYNAFSSASNIRTLGSAVSALFQASLLASVQAKSSPVDLWNNVKIPMLDELSPWTTEMPGNPWIGINYSGSNRHYSSLSGLNINGLPQSGESLFSVETSYMQLRCDDGTVYPSSTESRDYAYVFPNGLLYHNASNPFIGMPYSTDNNQSIRLFVDTSYERVWSKDDTVPLNLLYGSQPYLFNNSMILHNCTVGTARVEAAISCQGESCKVVRMRRSTVDTRSPLIVPFVGTDPFANFCTFFAFAAGIFRHDELSPIDYYVLGSSDLPFSLSGGMGDLSFNITGDMFARRLSTMINTIWQASLGPHTLSLGPSALSTYDYLLAYSYFANTTTARVSTPVDLYRADRIFIGILMVVSILLIACAVAGLILKSIVRTPDILGYVSTQTRDNLYVDIAPGGNMLDGLERAKLLGGMKVQVGDVKWEEDEGHVAFRSVRGEKEWALGQLKRGKLYL
ncbi:hypothetical protein GJ744_001079 [Endocarpon pusillum]|uniref:Uncharacterized protein n=1 Tax=Endocarpon pusillum TaxID=364733 RepID=A0A8H7ACP9_9EURO|nr:hypothetical protein GJ744_001079 [Endocarpon pusillum]